MVFASADDRLMVASDSRLDNRAELLKALSEPLRGAPAPEDAELIAASYLTWGLSFPIRLLGDFAFVLWDARERLLLAARDPLGIRRLHYTKAGTQLCIATEPSQLLCHPAVSTDLDERTIADFLCGLLDPPERTMYRQIRALRPGHRLLAAGGTVTTQRFWDVDLTKAIRYRDQRQYAEQLSETLRQAVSDRLPTDPESSIGISLSGGLDSCSIAALAADELRQDPLKRKVVTASLTFGELPTCDERSYIETLARSTGISPSFVSTDDFGFLSDTPHHPDPNSPFMAWESAASTLFSTLRDAGASAVLTGIGGDEMLTGNRLAYFDRLRRGDLAAVTEIFRYAQTSGISPFGPWYRCFVAPALGGNADRVLRRVLGKTLPDRIPSWLAPSLRQRSGIEKRLSPGPSTASNRFSDRSHRALYEAIAVQCGHMRSVTWFDRRLAAQGLEARHPFLDRRVFELVLAFPSSELFCVQPSKPLLRRAMRGILPDSVRLRRDKTSLAAYTDLRLREREVEIVDGLLTDSMLGELGLVEPKSLRSSYLRYRTQRPDTKLRGVWNAITLESWLRKNAGSSFKHSSPEQRALVA